MSMNPIRKKTLPLALLSLSVAASPVAAQSLLERFFHGDRTGYRMYETYPAPPRPAPAPVRKKIAKISGPSYYSYKTDALKAVDLMPLHTAAIPAKQDLDPSDAFVAALADVEVHAEAEIGSALSEFYAEHREFIWIDADRPNQRAIDAIRVLGEADSFGLEPADYAVSLPKGQGGGREDSQRELARFEIALSARVLRYVLDARNGRVVPDRISGYHDMPRKEVDLPGALKAIAHMKDVRTYLESRHPQNEHYLALRRELEMLRASPDDTIDIDRTSVIKPGQAHADFPVILSLIERKATASFRDEFGSLIAAGRGKEEYAPELAPAIKAAQKEHGLAADGVIGPRTIATLAGESRDAKLEKVRLALERLRWLPSDLGDPHVFINAASFRVTFRENGRDRLSMRAIVGTKANQTYFFQDKIQQVDFNPYWGVPQSILVNEMLPRLHRDPSYLDRAGYEVFASNGRQVSSASVDWWQYNGKVPFDVRQKPGPSNALGELKILFPNTHAIYMHDTPEKNLFGRDTRAFSHGCVRLEDPRAMAAAVLGWQEEEVAARLRNGHSTERVTADIPVYVAYFTAWSDADGRVTYHGDVYDRDIRLRKAMSLTSESRQAGS